MALVLASSAGSLADTSSANNVTTAIENAIIGGIQPLRNTIIGSVIIIAVCLLALVIVNLYRVYLQRKISKHTLEVFR